MAADYAWSFTTRTAFHATDLGTLGRTFTTAVLINDRGQVAGTGSAAGYKTPSSPATARCTSWARSAARTAGPLTSTTAARSSATRAPPRETSTPSSTAAGAMTDLGTLPGDKISSAVAINDRGQVVGNSPTIAGVTHAFLSSDGAMTDLGTLGGTTSYATAINDRGQVVGSAETTPGSYIQHGFLYSNGAMTDLNSLVPTDSLRGITITDARAINEWGQIAAIGVDPTGDTHVLLLTPASPEFNTSRSVQL